MADIRRRAAAYSDPRLGVAFENIADIFAPPSGSDLYGYTRAASERQKAQRLDDVYRRATVPGATVEGLDLPAIAAGLYAPNASGWAVRTKDNTDRRGQDIESTDRRYRTDVEASTSRANNTADNDRALNVAIMAPTPKDAIVTRPPAVAAKYGVPEQTIGVIAAGPGEVNYLPDGRVLRGDPKPQTKAEVEGSILSGLSDEEKRAIVYGNTPVVETNKGPMTRPQQLATKTPALSDKNPQVFNTKNGPVIWDNAMGMYVDPVSRRPVDVSGGLQSPSAVQAKDPLGPTTANQTEATRKEAQLNEFDAAIKSYRGLLQANPGIVGVPGVIRGAAQNALSVVQEFSTAFGNTPLDSVITPDDAKRLAATVGAGQRDQAIAQARVFEADLAYKWAQMQNPTGEVSRQAFERALEAITGGSLRNNQSALEALDAMEAVAKRARTGVQSLRNPGATPVDSGAPAPSGPRVIETPAGKVTIEQVQ